jgi:hypothetical protein
MPWSRLCTSSARVQPDSSAVLAQNCCVATCSRLMMAGNMFKVDVVSRPVVGCVAVLVFIQVVYA